jgi:competence protein ComEA
MRDSLWGWSAQSRRIVLIAFAPLALVVAILSIELRWRGHPADARLVIDLNAAPPEVLLALPRLGPVLVDRIVQERQFRPFRSLADFDGRVKGIGPATVAALAPYLRFKEAESPKTVVIAADALRPLP